MNSIIVFKVHQYILLLQDSGGYTVRPSFVRMRRLNG
jgi:hypothetical protein